MTGSSPLHFIVVGGTQSLVDVIVTRGWSNVNVTNKYNSTPLHQVNFNVRIETMDKFHITQLQQHTKAVLWNRQVIAQTLINAGANINAIDSEGIVF